MDGRLGVAFGLNAEQRKFGSDNVETGGAWDGNALEEFERRDYRITRERVGAGLNLEFKPAKGQLYYLRSMASQFSDDEVRNAHTIAFDAPQEAGVLGDAESVRSLKARKETQRIYSLALGTDQTLGDWELNLAGGVSRASETTPRSISAADFDGGTYSNVGFTDGRTPTLLAPASINEAAGYSLSEIELEENAARDREYTLKLDLAKSLPIFGAAGQIKFGGKISRRTKTNDQTTWTSDDFGPAPTDLASYAGPSPRYPFGAFGPTIQPGAIQAILPGSVIEVDEVESVINDYTMKENLDAAYVQSKFQLADWHLIAGVRYEGTRFTASGTGYDEGAGTFMPRDSQHRDDHWLPGLHARHDLDDTTSLRAAWTNTVVRPTFEQLRPGFTIDGSEGEFGNPDLKPLRSSNLDLGIERRLGYAGAVSVYGFHKNIRDFVFQTTADMSAAFPGVTDATTYANGGQAKVYGVELAYTQALRSLPAPWNGLLVGANATFSDSRADVSVGACRAASPCPASPSASSTWCWAGRTRCSG